MTDLSTTPTAEIVARRWALILRPSAFTSHTLATATMTSTTPREATLDPETEER